MPRVAPPANDVVNESPTLRAPKQERSARVLARLLTAAKALLRERDFDAISVGDIAARAGLSVGVLYTRFPSKEHLLVHLARDIGADARRDVERALSDEAARGLGLAELADRYFSSAAEYFRTHRNILRAITLLVRTTEHEELRAIVAEFNSLIHRRFVEQVLMHRAAIRHADAEAAVRFALLASSAALREVLLYGEPVSRLGRPSAVARDAARLFVSYLTWEPKPRRAARARRER
jgi:AcrR family transcriptional regulator